MELTIKNPARTSLLLSYLLSFCHPADVSEQDEYWQNITKFSNSISGVFPGISEVKTHLECYKEAKTNLTSITDSTEDPNIYLKAIIEKALDRKQLGIKAKNHMQALAEEIPEYKAMLYGLSCEIGGCGTE